MRHFLVLALSTAFAVAVVSWQLMSVWWGKLEQLSPHSGIPEEERSWLGLVVMLEMMGTLYAALYGAGTFLSGRLLPEPDTAEMRYKGAWYIHGGNILLGLVMASRALHAPISQVYAPVVLGLALFGHGVLRLATVVRTAPPGTARQVWSR